MRLILIMGFQLIALNSTNQYSLTLIIDSMPEKKIRAFFLQGKRK